MSLLKQFDLASTNFYKFFLTQLLLFKEIFIESERIFNINKNKYFKNEDNLIEDLFLKNELLLFLNSNKFLIKAEEQFKLNYWKLNINKVQNIFKIILEHEVISKYSNKKINSYQLVHDMYKNIIVCNEELLYCMKSMAVILSVVVCYYPLTCILMRIYIWIQIIYHLKRVRTYSTIIEIS